MSEIIGPSYPWSEIVRFIWYRKLAALATVGLSGEPRVDPLIYASDKKWIASYEVAISRLIGSLPKRSLNFLTN